MRQRSGTYFGLFVALSTCLAGIAQGNEGERPRVGTHLGVAPIFNYSSDRGLSLGLLGQVFDYGAEGRLPFRTLTSAEAKYATQGARDAFVSFERTGIAGGFRLYSEVHASVNVYQPYYGVGDSTRFERSLWNDGAYFYDHREFSLLGSLRKATQSGWDLRLGLGASYASSRANAGESVYLADFGNAVREGYYTKVILGVVLEERDFEIIASQGRFVSVSATASPGVLGELESWARFDFDYRRYDSIIPDRWLWFATQFRATANTPSAPLTEKARIGSWGTLRGYSLGRFVSNVALSLRTELRTMPVRWNIFGYPLKGGAGVFLDTGLIADSVSRVGRTPLRWAWGVSLFGSYFTDDFIGSADFGFSPEGSALYLRLGHAI